MGLNGEEQMREFVEALSLLDKDGNDFCAWEELATAIKSLGQNTNEGEILRAVSKVDDMEFGKFLNQITRKMKEIDAEEELKEVFKVFDRDQNGYISANELRNVMMSLGEKLTDEEAEQMIKEADLDGDDKVSYEEFVVMMKNI